MKPIRVQIRIKNNRMVKLREELGLSMSGFSEAVGLSIQAVMALENFKRFPFNKERMCWTETAEKIAAFHGVSPEFIWPEEIAEIRKTAFRLEANAAELQGLPSLPAILETKQLRAATVEAFRDLTPIEEKFLLKHCEGATYEELGHSVGLSRTRARDIILSGAAKLGRAKTLKDWSQ